MTGAWIGSVAGLALTNSLVMPLAGNSWRTTFLFYAVVVFLAGTAWWFLGRDIRQEMVARRMGLFRTLAEIVGMRNVRLMLVMGFVTLATISGYNAWLPKVLESGGLSPEMAGLAASVGVFAGIPAVLVMPHVIPMHVRGRALAVCALGVAIGLWGVVGASGPLQYAAIALLGFTVSAFIPVLTLIMMDSSGVPLEYLGSANGVFMSVAQIGGFLSPLMMGALLDMTGGFLAGVLVLAALNAAIIPAAFGLRTATSASADAVKGMGASR